MVAGEHTPETQGAAPSPEQSNILKLLKDKVKQLVDKVKTKFTQPTSQEDAEKLLEAKPVQLPTPEETQTKQKELRDSLKQLNNSLDEGNKQQLVADVKTVAQDLVAIAQDKNAETKVKDYAEVINAAANKVTEVSAIPFARYLTQVAGDNALAIRTEDDILQHLRRIKHIFLEESELQSNDLNAAATLMEGILKKNGDLMHAPTIGQAGEIISRLMEKGAQSMDAYNQLQEMAHRVTVEQQQRNTRESGRHSPNESPSINTFVGAYKDLEKAIIESEFPGESDEQERTRRKLLYNLLEININHETEKMREIFKGKTDYAEALDDWQHHFKEHYLHGLDHSSVPIPPEVRAHAEKYADEFVDFMKVRINRLKNYYQGMGDRDTYTGITYQPPTDLSRFFEQGAFDDAYIALAFIDAEGVDNKNNLDIKDIFMRFKLKAALEHEHHGPGSHDMDRDVFDPSKNTLDVNYEQIEHSLLNTFKAPYLRAYRYQLEGNRGDEEFQYILRKVENLIGGRKFSESPETFTFLGGSADVGRDKSRALQLRVKSKLFTESPVSPGLHGKGFLETQKYTVSLKHRSLGELMSDFHEKISHVHHIAEHAKRMQEAVRDGKSEAMHESARIFTNEVLDSMGLESPIILNAMLAYVNTFKSTVYAGQGTFRPSLFSSSPEGNESPQDAALKRAIRSTHPEATEDELVVFSTIGKALAWGVGDLGRWMARVLPPMDTLVKEADMKALSDKMNALQSKEGMPEEVLRKARTDTLFDYLAQVRPDMATVFYDQYARAFLAQTNPFFHLMIWADTSHEYKLQELLFGGEYTVNSSDARPSKVKGINPLRMLTEALPKPVFSRKDTLATPMEILTMAEREKTSLYDGLDELTFQARLDGRAPIMLKLAELAGNTGISERAGWRMDSRQTESFIHQFVRDRAERKDNPKPVTDVFSADDIKSLIDRSLILGPYAGLEVIKACFGTPGIGANTYISPDMQEDQGVFEDYVYKKMYEYFPSIFVGRMDMRRHVRKEKDIFSTAWYKEIYSDLYQNPNSELHELIPKESYVATLQRDSETMMEVRATDPKARAVQNLLFDAQLILESSILEQRNAIKDYHQTIPTLRETLDYLAHTDFTTMSREELDELRNSGNKKFIVAERLTGYLKEANLLTGDPSRLMSIIARNLYRNLYSSSSKAVTVETGSGGGVRLSNAERGLVGKLKFEDIGAETRADREKEVDTFKFLRNLKRAGLSGPVFDFYYENLGDFFSAQLTGDRSSGKELINRKYADLGTYIKGMGQSMGALNKIVDGVKSFNGEDLKKAEGAFLSAVNEAASTFENYNDEKKRHEMAYHLMLQWIMMGRIPGRAGFDLRFSPWGLPMSRELMWQRKSLAELVGDMGNGLINSAMVYDTQETENFIFEAQRKGILPINRDGKVLQAVEKRRQAIGRGAFTRVFDNVDAQIKAYEKKISDPHRNILEKLVGIPEHLGYQVYKGLQKFGNGAVNPTLARDDKYQWSAGRMLELTGTSMAREYMQFGIYAFYFSILLLLLALGNGAKELDIK